MRAVFSHSDHPDSARAIQSVLDECRRQLGEETPRAGLLFCSVDYDHAAVLAAIQEAFPGLPVIGASSDGELSSRLGFCDDSVLLTLFAGDDVRVHAGLGRNLSADIDAAVNEALAGCTLVRPALCITTFAPSTNSSEVLRSLSRALKDAQCPVVGGLSGDHREYSRTTEYFGTTAQPDSLPVLLLEGEFSVSWGVGSGWFPVGAPQPVTRASGHEVQEIGGTSALDFYRAQYGEVPADSLGEFPLALTDSNGATTLRAILARDDSTGALRFAGEVPEGASVRVTEVLEEGLLQGSSHALGEALDRFDGSSPELALVFTCAARKWVLGADADREVEVLRRLASDRGLQALGIVGLYCFGEIAPVGRENAFHNETCVSVVLGPR